MKERPTIASTTIDENTGNALIYIDGVIAVPKECDDPIVELFRPIRLKYAQDMLFSTYTIKRIDSVIFAINASNGRNRPLEEFLSIATEILEGSERYPGMIREYTEILDHYFSKPTGLEMYLKLAQEVEEANSLTKAAKIKACNDSIKKFVAEQGLVMPSFKMPRVRKEPKGKKEPKKPAN